MKKAVTSRESKLKERKKIAADVECFLKSGGKIEKIKKDWSLSDAVSKAQALKG